MVIITPRQVAILGFIVEYTTAHGQPPRVRDIGSHFAIQSTNGVAGHLLALEKKGYIARDNRKPRGITVRRSPC